MAENQRKQHDDDENGDDDGDADVRTKMRKFIIFSPKEAFEMASLCNVECFIKNE